MRIIIVIILCLFLTDKAHTQNYWQQNADYKINVDLNVKDNTYKGDQEILYKNNSRDTLNKIFFHLYFNAFKVGSDMAVRLENGDDKNKKALFLLQDRRKFDLSHVKALKAKKYVEKITV